MSKQIIALIDDDQKWVDSVRRLLAEEGFDVAVAQDGSTGLDLLEQSKPALVILDVHLPRISGFEVLRDLRLRKLEVPVVMVSGDDQSGLVVQALAEGATSFLRKPVSNDLLVKAIRRLLIN